MALFNLARMTVTSTGTGTITLNNAVSGFLTFDLAGCSTAATGQALTYAINDTTASEIASGTYYSSALALTRGSSTTGLKSTNSNSPIAMSNAAQVFITPQALGVIGKVNVQTFTANGTYTPTTGLIVAVIECVGAGGGGGGVAGAAASVFNGGGGGGGGYSRKVALASAIGTSQAVTIGAGGNGGAAGNNNGVAGTDTSVGALCIGKGGAGGVAGAAANQPSNVGGGAAGTGDFTFPGGIGGAGFYCATATGLGLLMTPGQGGATFFGGGTTGSVGNTAAVAGVAGFNYGCGGSGASCCNATANAAGGNGASGAVIITEFCSL